MINNHFRLQASNYEYFTRQLMKHACLTLNRYVFTMDWDFSEVEIANTKSLRISFIFLIDIKSKVASEDIFCINTFIYVLLLLNNGQFFRILKIS